MCFSLDWTRILTPSNDLLAPISSMLAWLRHRARSRMTIWDSGTWWYKRSRNISMRFHRFIMIHHVIRSSEVNIGKYLLSCFFPITEVDAESAAVWVPEFRSIHAPAMRAISMSRVFPSASPSSGDKPLKHRRWGKNNGEPWWSFYINAHNSNPRRDRTVFHHCFWFDFLFLSLWGLLYCTLFLENHYKPKYRNATDPFSCSAALCWTIGRKTIHQCCLWRVCQLKAVKKVARWQDFPVIKLQSPRSFRYDFSNTEREIHWRCDIWYF